MSKYMSYKEFANLIHFIEENNSPRNFRDGVPSVKYVDPTFDMRTNVIFAIKFRGFGSEKLFHTQNECRDLPDSLYERCMKYLNGDKNVE